MNAYYFWHGSYIPKFMRICIRSWEEFGLTPIRMNIDMEQYRRYKYGEYCFRYNNLGHLANFARFLWFEKHEGIYVDTDMFLCDRVPEEFIDCNFALAEELPGRYNQAILFSKKNSYVASKMVDYYKSWNKTEVEFQKFYSPDEFAEVFFENKVKAPKNSFIDFSKDLRLFHRTYAYPVAYLPSIRHLKSYKQHKRNCFFSEKTFAIHQWQGSLKKDADLNLLGWKEANSELEKFLNEKRIDYFSREY